MFKNITLEMSLKPFKQLDPQYIDAVCEMVFTMWRPLVHDVPVVSVMLWAADGSEILDYRGKLEDRFEWCHYIGGANQREEWNREIDPEGLGLHVRNYPYMEHPPEMTYAALKQIVSAIKRVGRDLLKKQVLVGATFDPGPEFAVSDFKYNRHNEICSGGDMGKNTMVCAYEKLKGDTVPYAGFPDGIPDGLPFGTFFGRQTNIFLRDMGFDYIWLSNGMGFGRETWSAIGAVFDGKRFDSAALPGVKKDVVAFWTLFRKECPDYPIYTRGTNLSAGIDYATDGVPLKTIYDQVPGLVPPPNSPWAALNADFGLELMGHMSRIAELPQDAGYMFRYYIHDPWWVNSPWYDRYGEEPHDIYLPMALSRISAAGEVQPPSYLNILSIDNSWGDMPEACVNEPLPHLRKAYKDAPDQPAPVVWVYPFAEYCAMSEAQELNEMFFGDWFIRNGINDGFPLSSVISTQNFIRVDKRMFSDSVLVTPVPIAGSAFESELLAYIQNGGKVLFYGGVERAGSAFLEVAGIRATPDGICGELPIAVDGVDCGVIKHDPLMSAGKINTVCTKGEPFAEVCGKAVAVKNQNCIWIRGTNSADYQGGQILSPHDETRYYTGERLLRTALGKFGIYIRFEKEPGVRPPVIMLSRSNNAVMVSVFSPSATVKTKLRFPLGAPVLCGWETKIEDGCATYYFPKSMHKACRVFVEQSGGIVGVHELPPVSYQMRRRLEICGLENAVVRIFSERYCKDDTEFVLNSHADSYFVGDPVEMRYIEDAHGCYWEGRNITGTLVCSMPRKKEKHRV